MDEEDVRKLLAVQDWIDNATGALLDRLGKAALNCRDGAAAANPEVVAALGALRVARGMVDEVLEGAGDPGLQ